MIFDLLLCFQIADLDSPLRLILQPLRMVDSMFQSNVLQQIVLLNDTFEVTEDLWCL